jgi:hypothetical protein
MGKDLTDLFIEQIMWFPGVQETQGEMFGERSFRIEGMARGLAHQHPYAPRSGMVELRLRKEDQLGAALGLAKQSYDYTRRRIQKAAAQAAD